MPKALATLGPFRGLNTKSSQFYLPEGMGAVATNVDISANPEAYSSALGRALNATFTDGNAYSGIIAANEYVTYDASNPGNIGPARYVLLCIGHHLASTPYYAVWNELYGTLTTISPLLTVHNPGGIETGLYSCATNQYMKSWTQGVQYQDKLYLNNGLVFYVRGTAQTPTYHLRYTQMDEPQSPQGIALATVQNIAPPSSMVGDYAYAFTWRRCDNWLVGGGGTPVGGIGDNTTYQESTPSIGAQFPPYSAYVITDAAHCIGFVFANAATLAAFVHPQSDIYMALYRSSLAQPEWQFVDYMANMPTTGGNIILDQHTDAQIAINSTLTLNQDMTPFGNNTYYSVFQLGNVLSTGFYEVYKNRLWAFGLKPFIGQGIADPVNSTQATQVQSQLWASNYDTPYAFNAASGTQVILVGQDSTPGVTGTYAPGSMLPSSGPTEDVPMGIAKVGSMLTLFKSRTTHVLFGDTPQDFIEREAFNIGCISPSSVTKAEGGVFWLAPQGVFFFDGASPNHISESIDPTLATFSFSSLESAEGSYQDKTYLLSIGGSTGTTFCYYIPLKQWYTLPYGCDAAVFSETNLNELLFLYAPGSGADPVIITSPLTNTAGDYVPSSGTTQNITSTWEGAITASDSPGTLSRFQRVVLLAPVQPGTAEVSLFIDGTLATTSPITWDLSKGPIARCYDLPTAKTGYTAQLSITTVTAGAQIVLWQCFVVGDQQHPLKSTFSIDGATP